MQKHVFSRGWFAPFRPIKLVILDFMRKMEASGFLTKMEVDDERGSEMSPSKEKGSSATGSLYVYSFDEIAFNKAEASKEWRKYPFDF